MKLCRQNKTTSLVTTKNKNKGGIVKRYHPTETKTKNLNHKTRVSKMKAIDPLWLTATNVHKHVNTKHERYKQTKTKYISKLT